MSIRPQIQKIYDIIIPLYESGEYEFIDTGFLFKLPNNKTILIDQTFDQTRDPEFNNRRWFGIIITIKEDYNLVWWKKLLPIDKYNITQLFERELSEEEKDLLNNLFKLRNESEFNKKLKNIEKSLFPLI